MATTFTRKTKTIDPETNVMTVVESTIAGAAVKVKSDVVRFQALGLSLTENLTLLFTPTTYGETPEPGDEVVWPANGTKYHVEDVDAVAPDGVTIIARIAIGR